MSYYQSWVTSLSVLSALSAGAYFTSVWVRKGYEGKDKQLDLMETGVFYKHVLGFIFAFITIGVIFLPPITGVSFPEITYIFLGGIFTVILGSEVITDIAKSPMKFKNKFLKKDDIAA